MKAILIHDIVFGRWDKNGLVPRLFPAFQSLNTENERLVYFGSSELVSILQVIKVNYPAWIIFVKVSSFKS